MNTKGILKESYQTNLAPFLYKEVGLEIFFASRTHIQREPQNSFGDLQKESAKLEAVKETIIESRMSGER